MLFPYLGIFPYNIVALLFATKSKISYFVKYKPHV